MYAPPGHRSANHVEPNEAFCRLDGLAEIRSQLQRLNMLMLKNVPQLVCTEWNAKYMPMICYGFVIQYLAKESKLPV